MSSWFLLQIYIPRTGMSALNLIYKFEVVTATNVVIGLYSQDRNTNVNILYTDPLPYPIGQTPGFSQLTHANLFNVSTLRFYTTNSVENGIQFRDEYLQSAISNSTPFFWVGDYGNPTYSNKFWVYRINITGSNTDDSDEIINTSVTISATTAPPAAPAAPAAPIPIACFKENTKILTNKGYIPIQELRKGDLVKTVEHGYKPIDMIGKRDITHKVKSERIPEQLYKCSQTQFNEVFEDLIITGCHSILVPEFKNDEREKTQKLLGDIYVTDNRYRLPACLDERTTVYEKPGTYTIYHFALENEDYYMNYGVYANGLLVESCSKRYLKEISNMEIIN